MFKKWHIIIVLVITTLLGGFYQDQYVAANQEIVLHYEDSHISNEVLQKTVSEVEHALIALGASQIEVVYDAEGKLKVLYYSDLPAAAIRSLIHSDEVAIDLNSQQSEIPVHEEQQSDIISFDVYELSELADLEIDTNGTTSESPKFSKESFSKEFVHNGFNSALNNYQNELHQTRLKIYTITSFGVQYKLHIIPEVRAGPSV